MPVPAKISQKESPLQFSAYPRGKLIFATSISSVPYIKHIILRFFTITHYIITSNDKYVNIST